MDTRNQRPRVASGRWRVLGALGVVGCVVGVFVVESVWGAARAREVVAVLSVVLGVAFIVSTVLERRALWAMDNGDPLLKRWRSWLGRGVVGPCMVWFGFLEVVTQGGCCVSRPNAHHFGFEQWFFSAGLFAFVIGFSLLWYLMLFRRPSFLVPDALRTPGQSGARKGNQ